MKLTKKLVKKPIWEIAKEFNKDNFNHEFLWYKHIIAFQNQTDEQIKKSLIEECWNNGWFSARQIYIKEVYKEIKKNKTLEDWQKFAEEFVEGFGKDGNIK